MSQWSVTYLEPKDRGNLAAGYAKVALDAPSQAAARHVFAEQVAVAEALDFAGVQLHCDGSVVERWPVVSRSVSDTQPGQIPTPTAPPAHPYDRITTIGVAIIAAVGVLLGGVVAAGSAWWTANVTANSNKAIEQDKFKREEREKAYHQYLDDVEDMRSKAAAISASYLNYGVPNFPIQFGEQVTDFQKSEDKANVSRHLVDLVGSTESRQIASRISDESLDISAIATNSIEPWYEKTRSRHDEIIKATGDFNDHYHTVGDQIEAFIKATRVDLGIADVPNS